MVVYLDIIWALNLFFDALLLYLTALILKREIKTWRVFLGGLIGSLLILLTLTPFEHTGHPLVKLLFSVMMVLSVFGYKRFSFFLKSLMTFYLVTFLIGGALTGVHYFIQFDLDLTSSVAVANVKGFGDPVSWLFVLLGFPLAWHFSKQSIDQIDMVKIQYEQIVDVKIGIDDLSLELRGLVDSGNQLYDPISRMPVMFVSLKSVEDIIPEPIKRIAENSELVFKGDGDIPEDLESRIRIIPCRVVGQEHQLVIAMKPDFLEINRNGNIHPVERVLVSFTVQQLSADESFQCIVHPKMLAGISTGETGVRVS